jgi:hypothetical protein
MRPAIAHKAVGTGFSSERISHLRIAGDGAVYFYIEAAMSAGDQYRVKAAELRARAHQEPAETQAELEALAQSYLRLADQAERNSQTDIVYETPSRKAEVPPVKPE